MAHRIRHRSRLQLEHLEERVLMHGDPNYRLTDHVHLSLSVYLENTPVTIPANIGVQGTQMVSPHTHAADGILHIHPPVDRFPTLGDFFEIWRTRAGDAGNNPNAFFNQNRLLDRTVDANHRVLMYVNYAPNTDYENYLLRLGDQIVLSFEEIPGPSDPFLPPLPNQTAAAGKPLYVPLDAVDPAGGPLTYTVSSSNPQVTATILQGNSVLRLDVEGTDDEGNLFTGTLLFYLFEDLVPVTTARIVQLVNEGFYDGLTFHRIIDGFVIQGGDPTGTGTGGSGVPLNDEFHRELVFTGFGQLAMANAGDDTNDSQFFITDTNLSLNMTDSPEMLPPQHLNFQHTIFGQLISGFETFERIITTPTDASNRPLQPVRITDAEIVQDPIRAVLKISASPSFTGSSLITIQASNSLGKSFQRSVVVNVVADRVNDRPFLGPVQDQQTLEDTPVTLEVEATDLENDALTFVVRDANTFLPSALVQVGVVPVGNNRGRITLTPASNAVGSLPLILGVRDQTARDNRPLDDRSQFDTQRFTLTILAVNDAPVAQAAQLNTPVDTPLVIQLQGDDGDPEVQQELTFEIVTQPSHGSLVDFNPATGQVRYIPASGFQGQDSFTFRVRDNGGTANGGQDTSEPATVRISVGQLPPVPQSLQLAPPSDTGKSNTDRYTSAHQLTIRIEAAPALTVKVNLNGQSVGNATEVSPGVYERTLVAGRDPVRLGSNTVTAVSSNNVGESAPSAPLQFVFAPRYDTFYFVPGTPGQNVSLTFRLTHRIAGFRNEVGLYRVDGPDGAVGGVRPGSPNYARAVLGHSSRQVLFSPTDSPGTTKTVQLPAGATIGFYLVQNGTSAQWLEAAAGRGRPGPVFFSIPQANPDGVDHMRHVADPWTGLVSYFWEDLLRGGDRDFNDAVMEITPPGVTASAGEALRIPGPPGQQVPLQVRLLQPRRTPGSQLPEPTGVVRGELGIFPVDNLAGNVSGVAAQEPEYLRRVASHPGRQVIFTRGARPGDRRRITVEAGKLYGFYYVVDGTLQEALQQNPSNDSEGRPIVVYSFQVGNPTNMAHFRWFEPELAGMSADELAQATADRLRLHILDTLLSQSNLFDDLLVELQAEELF
jgi:cyclophilin family peptidyl-prolyl cis-trans isomerase